MKLSKSQIGLIILDKNLNIIKLNKVAKKQFNIKSFFRNFSIDDIFEDDVEGIKALIDSSEIGSVNIYKNNRIYEVYVAFNYYKNKPSIFLMSVDVTKLQRDKDLFSNIDDVLNYLISINEIIIIYANIIKENFKDKFIKEKAASFKNHIALLNTKIEELRKYINEA